MEFHLDVSLNEAQTEVVKNTKCHMLVHGVCGSGKTYTYLSRIAFLRQELQIPADQMLNLCADQASSQELATAYQDFDACEDIRFLSLYAFAYRIVKQYSLKKGKTLRKPIRNLSTLLSGVAQQKFGKVLRETQLHALRQEIAYAKVMLLQPQEMDEISIYGITLSNWIKAYDYEKRRKQVMDFEDVIVEALHILMEQAPLREAFQEQYRFIQIDQAETLSFAAHLLIKALLHDDVIITMFANTYTHYHAQGAYPKSFDSFTTIYEGASVCNWNDSYTLSNAQVEAIQKIDPTNKLISSQTQEDHEVVCKGFSDLRRLYAYATKQCEQDATVSITYANRAYALPLIDQLEKKGISYGCKDDVSDFFEDVVVKELLGYVQLLLHPKEAIYFVQAYQALQLDISDRIMQEVCNLMEKEDMDVFEALIRSSLKSVRKKELMAQMELIRMLQQKKTSTIIRSILSKLKYQARCKDLDASSYDAHLLVVKYMSQVYEEPETFITRMMELSQLTASQHGSIQFLPITQVNQRNHAHLMVLDCIEHHFPKQPHESLRGLDERVLFIDCLSYASKVELLGFKAVLDVPCAISSFVYAVHKKADDASKANVVQTVRTIQKVSECHLKVKTRIFHETLGEGTIKEVKDGMMQVHFASEEVRNLNIKFCLNNELIKLA